MTTTPEMTLLNYCEIHGHAESARILRAIVEKQRTPHSDTDAHPENPGSDLFAANAGITPEQARFAYDSALEAPTQAVPCDSRPNPTQEPISVMGYLGWARKQPTKHRWIYSDGTPRQEPCCR